MRISPSIVGGWTDAEFPACIDKSAATLDFCKDFSDLSIRKLFSFHLIL